MIARIRRSVAEHDEAFTLVELLVVIIIIGVLAAISIPIFLSQRKQGYQASEKSDLHTVANEMETYYADHQTYLGAIGGGVASTGTLTYGGAANSVGSDPVSLSPGNTIELLAAGVSGYCLKATSSKDSGGPAYYYNNRDGGLTSTDCSGADFS